MPVEVCRSLGRVHPSLLAGFSVAFFALYVSEGRFPQRNLVGKSQLKKVERIFKNRVDTQA